MARVEIGAQEFGTIIRNGQPVPNATVQIATLAGPAATHWSAVTGGTSSTANLSTDVDGVVGLGGAPRFIDEGTYNVTSGGTTRRVEAVSGATLVSAESGLGVVQGQVYNVKASAYGAVGNGSTDDQAAITAAINAANTAGGGTVYLPPGTYLISTTVTHKSNVHIVGAGMAATTIKIANSANIRMFNAGALTDASVRDLTIDGNKANGNTSYGMQFTSAVTRVVVERVRFLNTGSNAILWSAAGVDCKVRYCISDGHGANTAFQALSGTTFEGCAVRNSHTAASAVGIEGGTDCRVVNCHVVAPASGTAFKGVSVPSGASGTLIEGNTVDFTGSTNAGNAIATWLDASKLRIRGNRLIGPGATTTAGAGIHLGGGGSGTITASQCLIEGNYVEGFAADGILLGVASTDTGVNNVVRGNTIKDIRRGTGAALSLGIETQLKRTVISGNVVEGCDGQGIGLYNAEHSSVTGNVVTGCNRVTTGGGIKVAGSYITVSGNTSSDNGLGAVVGYGLIVNNDGGANVTDVTITGNLFSDSRTAGSKVQDYGIRVDKSGAFTVSNVYIAHNDLDNNKTGTLSIGTATNVCHTYVEAGALKYKGGGGTVTTLGAS